MSNAKVRHRRRRRAERTREKYAIFRPHKGNVYSYSNLQCTVVNLESIDLATAIANLRLAYRPIEFPRIIVSPAVFFGAPKP